MYQSKNFCSILPIVNNKYGEDSPIGELSAHGRTFTKNLGMYHSDVTGDYDLRNFRSDNDGIYENLTQPLVEKIVLLVNTAYQKTLNTSGEITNAEMLAELISVGAANGMSDVKIGAMRTNDTLWLPAWIQFKNTSDTRDNSHITWLSDADFRAQYPDYIIDVVPIFDRLDDFFLPAAQVKRLVDAVKIPQIMERLDDALKGKPASHRNADQYAYIDPTNSSNTFDVTWPCNIYTDIGNDFDIIREELAKHILANSTHTRDEWAQIFPDIFKKTEFIIAPWWNKYAVGARALQHGVHYPIINIEDIAPQARKFAPEYAAAHVNSKVQVLGFQFRSIVATSIGNIENRDLKHRISVIFPDYMNVSSMDPDFNRMSIDTQKWALKMAELLYAAEEWTEASQLPKGIVRIKRGNIVYIAATLNRVQYLVVSKLSNTALTGG